MWGCLYLWYGGQLFYGTLFAVDDCCECGEDRVCKDFFEGESDAVLAVQLCHHAGGFE